MLDRARGRRDLPGLAVIAAAAWAAVASAQVYSFPSEQDFGFFYPTAYYDHGGVTDWNCGGITYAGHRGSDFGVGGFAGMDAGRTITAAADGVVVATNDGEFDRCTTADCPGGGGFGNYVQIEHPDGKYTYYAHMKQWTVSVGVGDPVRCGTVLGEVGSSGHSTGPHLHFEVRSAGNTSEDPFDGPCSNPPTYWRDQGAYDALPDEACGPPPVCEPQVALACGAVLDARNDGPGSTDATTAYGCDEFVYVGPEQAFTLEVPVDTAVTVQVSGVSQDLDLMILDDAACDGTGCVAGSANPDASDESATFAAAAGTTYVVVVDGWEGAVSDFHLEVQCPELPEHTGLPGQTGPNPTGPGPTGAGGTGAGDGAPKGSGATRSGRVPTGRGCGCDGAFGPAALALPMAGLPVLGRRRRRT